ncbi:MAG TPA: serine/threonine protein kinase, partial [Myxococcaceae bacterium]
AEEAQKQKAEEVSQEEAFEELATAIQQMGAELSATQEKAARHRKRWRRIALVAGLVLLGLAFLVSWRVWLTPAPTSPTESEKGSSLVSTLNNSRLGRTVAAWLCTTFSVGCTAAQVRPLPEDCPSEAFQSMEEMGLTRRSYRVVIDINQPGTNQQEGIYGPGPIVSRVVKYSWTGPLPDGTLLYGRLWTEGIIRGGSQAVLGRYTEALLPDGRRLPVCIVLGDQMGLTDTFPGSTPGAARLPREWSAMAVTFWP